MSACNHFDIFPLSLTVAVLLESDLDGRVSALEQAGNGKRMII